MGLACKHTGGASRRNTYVQWPTTTRQTRDQENLLGFVLGKKLSWAPYLYLLVLIIHLWS